MRQSNRSFDIAFRNSTFPENSNFVTTVYCILAALREASLMRSTHVDAAQRSRVPTHDSLARARHHTHQSRELAHAYRSVAYRCVSVAQNKRHATQTTRRAASCHRSRQTRIKVFCDIWIEWQILFVNIDKSKTRARSISHDARSEQ